MTPTQIQLLVENLMARIEARPMCANCQHPINVSLSHVCTEEASEVLG